ncbi:TorF family putative porin [Massilia sp. PAMC28688]|uniref:TorF family putative porin n=1 Tax=Massilia sp. PAMC28688 TaxID=2861283 RepID=UPI001C629271|nr:TorF family putative porin [Massilia sp. PAMC28688]QYF94571.1 TorF family putative porin [Massilia sp. PAMC28688]
MKNLTNQFTLAASLALVVAAFAPLAHAADDAPEHAVSYNAAVTSDYRYRGLSQTRLQPALQGGADYTHSPSGFYLGAWASTIKWTKDLGGDGSVEIDLYGGKRGELSPGVSYDVGGLYYAYPSNDLNPDADTFELYAQLGYGPATLKYSHSTTNLFGTADSKGSGYVDLSVNQEIAPGLVLNLHAGRQMVKNNGAFSYNDYKIGVTKDLGFASLALAVVGTSTDLYLSPVNGKNLGRTGAVVTLSKTF